MTENLNLTELIEQLQQIVKDGRFEYTPTNVGAVKYVNHLSRSVVELDGVATLEAEGLRRDLDDAEQELCSLERSLDDAVDEIARLKKLLNQ